MAEFYTLNIRSGGPDETVRLGKKLAGVLRSGDVLALYGNLAAGKTTLTRGIAEALGADQPATSPTFTLINEYPGRIPLYHFDCYRIRTAREILYLGFEEYLDMEGIVIVEWPEKVEEFLPDDTVRIRMDYIDGDETGRTLRIESGRELNL